METTKAPTLSAIRADIRWTKSYISQLLEAKREGDYATASQLANEISAIWGTISWDFENAQGGN